MARTQVWWIVLLLTVALMLAGCGGAAPEAEPAEAESSGEAAAPDSGRCGDKSQLSDTVNFYNWSDYIDEEILTQFEEECGVKVIYDTFSSNEDLLAKLQGGASGYDLIVPSDYMVSIMIQLGLLKELDPANIPNMANIAERFRDPEFDPGNKYTVPYQWGTTGLGFDLDVVGSAPDSWGAIFDPAQAEKYAGKIGLLNDSREVIAAALMYLGFDPNTTNPDELEQAKQAILAIKPYVATFDSDTFSDLLVSGDTDLTQAWGGGLAQAIADNPDSHISYSLPKEGSVIWTDNLAIPKTAPNAYTAEVLMNYLLDPEIGAQITNYTRYASPNVAAEPYIDEEVKSNPAIYPPQEQLANAHYLRELGEATQLYERIWTEIKAQ